MKYLICIIILLIILSLYFTKTEGFTVYQINFDSDILPWWEQGTGLNRGYHRCICSGDTDCRCINDNILNNDSLYYEYYFN